MPKFKKGDPQLTFKRKDGKYFTKTYHSLASSKRAFQAWVSNGGTKPKIKKFSGQRKTSMTF